MDSIPFIFASGHRLSYWFISFSPDAFVFICRKLCQQNVAHYLYYFIFILLLLVFYEFFLLFLFREHAHTQTHTHTDDCSIINVFILSLFRVVKKEKKLQPNEIIIYMYIILHKEIELFGERKKKDF